MREIILHLSSGRGPEECRWVLAQLARVFHMEAHAAGLGCNPLEAFTGNPSSLLLRVTGVDPASFAQQRCGTILWNGTSPFRPNHKRRNWFVGVAIAPEPDRITDLREEDIHYQAMRASGPGGQHVNKTDSAIRAVHRPTGLSTTVQEQRSQHANRKLARLKLALLIEEQRTQSKGNARREEWNIHQNLERGNPVRCYSGAAFKLTPKS